MLSVTPRDAARFWAKVAKSPDADGCWLWIASTSHNGYGFFKFHNRQLKAHRFIYEWTIGVIPEGLHVLHRCDTPACVNPAHLFLGTHRDNMRDMHEKGRAASGDRNGTRLHPDRVARGDRNGQRLHPERTARGDRHPFALRPELRARGERVRAAKLNAAQVSDIRRRYAAGDISQIVLSVEFGVSQVLISRIVRRANWKHVQ